MIHEGIAPNDVIAHLCVVVIVKEKLVTRLRTKVLFLVGAGKIGSSLEEESLVPRQRKKTWSRVVAMVTWPCCSCCQVYSVLFF